jgi:glycerol-3-phosphate dehydrogenase (NAD(P)+)
VKIAVLGAGAWGTALAIQLADRHDVAIWVRDAQLCADIARTRVNARYLPEFSLPPGVRVEHDAASALAGRELAIVGTTMAGLRPTLQLVAAAAPVPPVVWLCKGFEAGSSRLAHEVAAEVLPAGAPCGVLSGPSFAQEVARGVPVAVALAAADAGFAAHAARALHGGQLRVYSTDDLIGVEVGGAVKNVIAIAAGISDGLGFGESARAALVTRGLAEITRLGVRLGGRPETFMGLSGVGDLILTCTGSLSRNRQVGLRLAGGKSLAAILGELGHVAEGVHSAREVVKLAREKGADMPIAQAVQAILYEGVASLAAVQALMAREPKAEHRD